MTHARTGKYKQPHIDMVTVKQPLVFISSEYIETGWQHIETVSADRGIEIQVRKK